jgi:hypothetical protein
LIRHPKVRRFNSSRFKARTKARITSRENKPN